MRRFFILFVIFLLFMFGIDLLRPVQTHVVLPFTGGLAQLCAFIVGIISPKTIAYGNVLMNAQSGVGVSIEPGCNGVEACIVLFAAILAFRSSWLQKLTGIAIGFVAIQVVNIIRIISLFYLIQWNRAWFDFFHEYLWQSLIMLDVLVVFMIWVRYCQRHPPSTLTPPETVAAHG